MNPLYPALRLGCSLLLLLCLSTAAAAEPAGYVAKLQGEAAVTAADGSRRALAEGAAVAEGERVVTAAGARLLLAMADGARITLGASSELAVTEYRPRERGVVRFVKGVFRAITGTLGPRQAFVVETPVATLGVRGTDFWGGYFPESDTELHVALLTGRWLEVRNAAGTVHLTAAGQGTTIPGPGRAPTPPKQWPAKKVKRALATVTFD